MKKTFPFFAFLLDLWLFLDPVTSDAIARGSGAYPRPIPVKENFYEAVLQKNYFFSLEEALIDLERPFLLIFFNTSCHVCFDELFVWKEFVENRRIPVQLVGITRDPEAAVSHFLKKYVLTFPVIIDRQGRLFRLYQVKLEPFLLLGRGQEIIYRDNLMEPIIRRREKLEQCLLALH